MIILAKKIFISPVNSLVLADIVERCGHKPLTMMTEIGKLVKNPEIDSPPMNITADEPRKGLRYAAVEIPSGVRGRLSIWGPLLEQADAAVIIDNADFSFGCTGCARSNELLKHLIKMKKMPHIVVEYPKNKKDAKVMVSKIIDFLNSLEETKEKTEETKDD